MIREANVLELKKIQEMVKNNFFTNLSLNEFSKVYIYFENEILGFLIFSIIYERAEIDYIYTLEEVRNKHIASKLLEKMFIDLKNKNIENVSLEVMIENNSAINLYSKFGFKTVSIRKNYYKDNDAYLMVREVD